MSLSEGVLTGRAREVATMTSKVPVGGQLRFQDKGNLFIVTVTARIVRLK